jgi:hypothetical protein
VGALTEKNLQRLFILRLAWLAVARRRRRTIISVTLLSVVIASSLSIGSTIEQLPVWVSGIAAASPNILLTYQSGSPIVGLLPENSSLPQSYGQSISAVPGVTSVTPLIVKDTGTSLPQERNLVIGLDIDFWQLDLGLKTGHWPEPGTLEAVVTEPNSVEVPPSTILIGNQTFDVVGVAVSADLGLAYSVIISYTTAQKIFNMQGLSSLFISELGPNADPGSVATRIDDLTATSLTTLNLTPSTSVLKTLTNIVGGISGTIVIVDAAFTFAIIAVLSMYSVNSRRWEYGLLATYGGPAKAVRIILLENLLLFLVSIVPALLIASIVLSSFVVYLNVLAGSALSITRVVADSFKELASNFTLYQYLADLLSALLGSFLAASYLLRRTSRELLSDSTP